MRRDKLVFAATAVLTAALAGLFTWYISSLPEHRPDFAMMWQAMRLEKPYDHAALNAALRWESRYPVAFVYPPTAMPFFGALALLPMRVALTVWAALSGAALALASRSKWSPLLLLLPPVLWAIPGGQTSVLQGSVLLGAILLLKQQPRWSGVLLAIALCLKPQLALAFPLLLLIERKWDVLVWTCVTVAVTAILSALLFGPSAWLDWARSLPQFLKLHEATAVLQRNEIAPGLPLWLRTLALLAGGWTAALAVRRGNPIEAFVIAAGAGLIGSAHAMGYEFAMFAAACPALLRRRKWSASAIILFLMTPGFIWVGLPAFPFRLLALLMLVAAAAADGLLGARKEGPNANPALVSSA